MFSNKSKNARAKASANRLAEKLEGRGYIRSPAVSAAFRNVPRHLFVPEVSVEQAYQDEVVPLQGSQKSGTSSSGASSASQPAIVATMLEQLDLEPGANVLEIGAASGNNAALMANIVGKKGRVSTLEIDEELVRRARRSLDEAGFERVEIVHADGSEGYPESAPYDRIILTAAAADIAPAWHEQLSPDGRLVLPLELWSGLQVCVAFELAGDHLEGVAAQWCGFVRLQGRSSFDDAEHAGESVGKQAQRGRTFSESTLEARLRALRTVSMSTSLPFPEWFGIRAYPQEVSHEPGESEVCIDRPSYQFIIEHHK